MSFFYKISIDHVNANYISGWCFHKLTKNIPVKLQCLNGGTIRGETNANHFREDLKELGYHPNGKCGFEFIFDGVHELDFSQSVIIRVKGGKSPLIEFDANFRTKDTSHHVLSRAKKLIREKRKIDKTAVFMHIPKTAGTSFNTVMQSILPRGTTIIHIELLPRHQYNSLSEKHQFISGHVRFGILKRYFNQSETDFYTIIREPYGQLHSHIKWLIQTFQNPDDNFFKSTNTAIYELGRRLSLVEFSSTESISQFVEAVNPVEAAFLDNLQIRYLLDYQPDKVHQTDLHNAIHNLEEFKLIGLTDQYDTFVNKFIELNGINLSRKTSQMNKSKSAHLFDYKDEKMRSVLEPLVWADLELYSVLINRNK